MSTIDAVPIAARSLLEEMLDSLKREDQKPKDVPPALPSRPASKGRLPSSRRSLPLNFKIESLDCPQSWSEKGSVKGEPSSMKEKDLVCKHHIFRSKRTMSFEQPEESPYSKMPELTSYKQESKNTEGADYITPPSSTTGPLNDVRWGDTINYVLKKKLQIWFRLPDAMWELGKIQSVSETDANILRCDGKVITASMENLLPANPDILDCVGDLIQLSYLNEPSVLHNLKYRFTRDLIYTKAGPILVAINPYKEVPLYGNDLIAAYKQERMHSPHVYAVADTAFREMMRDGINQSIIISGESGAGKTETAKIAMRYLVAHDDGGWIEHEVLQTNPILEAFGNAKTSINDNSSRFGKLTEVHFNASGRICGAEIQTFLLEKSRVVHRSKGERSYHVFYQLCAGAPPLLKEKLKLREASEYEYLRQSGCLRIDGVDDAQRFHTLMEAFDNVHISKEEQENAFAMVAAVLWLGNIAFSTSENENHVEVVLSEGVTNAAELIGCEVPELMLALSTHTIQADDENNVQKLTLSQAIDNRDALAKSIYACLFDWLVERINKSLEVKELRTGNSITILDIYGFETFQKNSFEQLCINYANERLQQHFNRHLLKLVQEEYTQDGIDWTAVGFVDNIECLNLFEKKPLGVFSLLEEESTSPKATDLTLANKLKQHLKENPCFKGERGCAFKVRHYGGEVLYHTNGFLVKNRDPLHSDFIQLLLSCGCQLSQLFASRLCNPPCKQASRLHHSRCVDSQKQSVGTEVKGQLFSLMQLLENTTPHFIRCIKPNNKHHPGMYENELVLQQFRCCGILEVVRALRLGYQTRMTHQQFSERYGFLLLKNVECQDPLSIAVTILQKFNIQPELYQVGYTKLFFRAGQIIVLEDLRNRTIQRIIWVQKCVRGVQAHRHYQEQKKGATTLQSFIRGEIARHELQKHLMQPVAQKAFNGQQMSKLNREKVNTEANKPQQRKDPIEELTQVEALDSAEAHSRLLRAEASLRNKEEKNLLLQQQLQQYEMRWSDYEAKMKSKEEMWRKQMSALQMSLATADKCISDASLIRSGYDSESAISCDAPTPPRRARASDAGPAGYSGRAPDSVGLLVKEFEQRSQAFEDDAQFLTRAKSGQSGSSVYPDEELRKLKIRFIAWKKDYKVRLRIAKEGEKPRRKWWGMRYMKT